MISPLTLVKMSALIVAGLLLGVIVYRYKRDHAEKQLLLEHGGVKTLVQLGRLPEQSFLSLDSKTTAPLSVLKAGSSRLVIFLSGTDCGSCLTILDEANNLGSLDSSRLEVDVVVVRSSQNEAMQIVESLRPRYVKTYLDSSDLATKALDVPLKTPLAVLLDSEYRVILAQGATTDLGQQEKFITAIRSRLAIGTE